MHARVPAPPDQSFDVVALPRLDGPDAIIDSVPADKRLMQRSIPLSAELKRKLQLDTMPIAAFVTLKLFRCKSGEVVVRYSAADPRRTPFGSLISK